MWRCRARGTWPRPGGRGLSGRCFPRKRCRKGHCSPGGGGLRGSRLAGGWRSAEGAGHTRSASSLRGPSRPVSAVCQEGVLCLRVPLLLAGDSPVLPCAPPRRGSPSGRLACPTTARLRPCLSPSIIFSHLLETVYALEWETSGYGACGEPATYRLDRDEGDQGAVTSWAEADPCPPARGTRRGPRAGFNPRNARPSRSSARETSGLLPAREARRVFARRRRT